MINKLRFMSQSLALGACCVPLSTIPFVASCNLNTTKEQPKEEHTIKFDVISHPLGWKNGYSVEIVWNYEHWDNTLIYANYINQDIQISKINFEIAKRNYSILQEKYNINYDTTEIFCYII